MRVVNRTDFLKLPAGTIYCKGKPWYFDGLCIKDDTLMPDDWVYLNPAWPSAHDSGEASYLMEKSLADGASFAGDDSYGRDGCFDKDAVFLIFEKEDLLALRSHIDAALTHC